MERHFKERKTKIVCTIGPSSNTLDMIEKMAVHGMDIARLNFSHGTHEDHLVVINHIKKINETREVPIGILLDTKGPEIRIGKFKEPVQLEDEQEITITTRQIEWSDAKTVSISYENFPKIVKKGSMVYIADGTIELRVEDVVGTEVSCKVVIKGELSTKKNVNVPGAYVDLPAISEQDVSDIEFGIKHGIDFIAQSFVKNPEDVLEVKEILKKNNAEHIHIIAKIEAFQALDCIDDIINVSDGIMVARGDLGVQIPIENIPSVQKMLIKKCNIIGKPVITATQMLESMTKNPRPTRAEATDVSNAIFDGTDAIMLSGETASGKHPLRAIETMDKLARHAEQNLLKGKHIWNEEFKHKGNVTVADTIGRAVCETAAILGASAILACTISGHTARIISSNRPLIPIYAVTSNIDEFKKLILVWGVKPILIKHPKDTDELIEKAIETVSEKKHIEKGDKIVITAGLPYTIPGNINMMKVWEV